MPSRVLGQFRFRGKRHCPLWNRELHNTTGFGTRVPSSRQVELTGQFTQRSQTIRQLVRHVIAAAKEEADVDRATTMLKQIESCGKWLEAANRPKIVQLLGKGLCMTAAKEIDQLPTE